jgi:membrane protein YqaA with SNARE-associated domain
MKRRNLEIIMLILVLMITAAIYFFIRSDMLRNLRHLGYAGVFLISLISSATIFVPVPGFVAPFFAGAMLNPFLVGVVAGVGSAIGELTGYSAGFGSRIVIEDKKVKNYGKIKKWMRINGFMTILILSFLPNPFFDIAGVIAGASEYPAWKFFISCCIGKSLRFIILALIGASIL